MLAFCSRGPVDFGSFGGKLSMPWNRPVRACQVKPIRVAQLAGSLAIATSLCLASPSLAQGTDPTLPPTREELAPPQARPEVRQPTTLTIDGGMERTPCALDSADFADIRFTLEHVVFQGAEKAPEIPLHTAWSGYAGREVPVAALCDIRSRAMQQLQQAGYLATVEIPEQRLGDGVATFRIVFGRLAGLRVRGDAGPSEGVLAAYLQKLVGQEVFNSRRAERYLLLADDIPGMDVRLSLRAAANGGEGDLIGEVAVVRRRPVLDLNVQNYGSKALGRFGGLLRGEAYDITGLGDRTSFALFSSADLEEQQTVQLGHDFRVGSDGLVIGGQLTFSMTEPSLNLPGFAVESETFFASLFASYPLMLRRESSIALTGGFDYANQDVELNTFPLSRDRVRTAFARIDWMHTDRGSINRAGGYTPFEPKFRVSGSFELRQGIDIFGATPDCRTNTAPCLANGATPPSRIESDATPLVFRMSNRIAYRPTPEWTLAATTRAQYSGDPLPAFEEFSAGTYSIGRGYDPGAILGDQGFGVGGELRYGSLVPEDEDGIAWQPYVFTDAAWVWNEDPSRELLNPDKLWSAGGGVRVAYGRGVQGDVTLAVPLRDTDFQPKGDVRLLVSLTARLFPWRFS